MATSYRKGAEGSGINPYHLVHLDTLKYRLKHIVGLMAIDFKDSNELFYLKTTMKLLPTDKPAKHKNGD